MSIQARILLVDDVSAIIEKLASFLERSSFDVKTATNGEESLANKKIEAPELIVSDVLMPKMDGRELLHSLRRDDNCIPAILLIQVGEAFERVMAIDEGVDDILTNRSNPTNWLFESGLFYTGKDQENYHSQQPGRLRVAI
jgi:DNA-binding response OmpR family regulator